MPSPIKTLRIIAYGFDDLGFQVPNESVSVGDDAQVEFLPLRGHGALDQADGVIIPQGIFEKLDYQRSYVGGTHTDVRVQTALLQERQKQVFNMIEDGKWVCFLVGTVIDKVPQGDWDLQDISDTDLCKRMLNALEITKHKRQTVDGLTIFNTKRDEFRRAGSDQSNFLI